MEKFAILNLLKAIDGLKSLSSTQNEGTAAPAAPAAASQSGSPDTNKSAEMPNIMYQTLVRHEMVSNRVRSKK